MVLECPEYNIKQNERGVGGVKAMSNVNQHSELPVGLKTNQLGGSRGNPEDRRLSCMESRGLPCPGNGTVAEPSGL